MPTLAPLVQLTKRMRAGLFTVGLLLGGIAIGCAPAADDDASTDDTNEVKVKGVTNEERASYIKKSQVWLGPSKVSAEDIIKGPPGEGSFAFNQEVTCDFVEPTKKDELNGASKKFLCKLPNGDEVKVKYGENADDNGEIYGEVMATRLLWVLGFPADRMYPVRVTCNGCPEDPWSVYKEFAPGRTTGGARATRKFASAVIEQKYDAAKIEVKEDQGWGWGEIKDDHLTEKNGGAPAAHLNGLKLLAAFMKHADNKAENQRLICTQVNDAGKCEKPMLMIQDMGVTFGGGAHFFGLIYNDDSRARFADWTSLNLWKDRSECKAELRDSITGTMTHPHILEAGRAFIAERLATLTDDQIRAIFVASRVEERKEMIPDIRENAPAKKRLVTVDDWRIGFKIKRDEIANHRCRD